MNKGHYWNKISQRHGGTERVEKDKIVLLSSVSFVSANQRFDVFSVRKNSGNYFFSSFALFSMLFALFALPCYAQNEFSLRIAPVVDAPLDSGRFSAGMGGAASLDWEFLSLAPKIKLGVFAGGGYTSIPVKTGSPMTLLEGAIGPFVRWRTFDRWAFRAGLGAGIYQYSRDDHSDTKLHFSFNMGTEFHLSPYFSLFADGGYTYRVFSAAQPLSSIGATLGVTLNISEIMGGRANVRVERTEQYRVFPVSWAWYEDNPVAMVKITNNEPNAITGVNLSFFMDSYMSEPWAFAAIPRLAPGESTELPVTALFNEAMINLTETITVNSEIQVHYSSLGAPKETSIAMQMPVFHRNTLSWDDDRRAAAFVSPRDSAARFFAGYVASAVEQAGGSVNAIPRNVRYATAMFEALRLYGIKYVVVPATSFVRVSSDESVLDNVSYPYQALHYRGGDCSYLSILFCSLLEAIGIETAFITIPGHLYAAFEIGNADGNADWQSGSTDIIELDGKRWLPVELTVPDEGFTRAWRIGARQWRTSGEQAALYSIRDSWEVYPPVTSPASGDRLPRMPARADIVRAMQSELNKR